MGTLATVAETYYVYTSDAYQPDPFSVILSLILTVIAIIGLWRMFEKADEPGWKALIPFYNAYTMFRIAGRNGWGFLLMFIPFVNFIVYIMVMNDLGKHFGKSTIWSLFLLMLFPFVGYLILGFGSDKYVGVKHQ